MTDPKNAPPEEGRKRLPMRPLFAEAIRQMQEIGPDCPRIEETHFKEFLGSLYNPLDRTLDTKLWYHVVGSWRTGLDVVDSAGRHLFFTPPLIGTIDTVIKDRDHSLSSLSDLVELNERRHALLGKATLDQGLRDYHTGRLVKVVDGWKAIFQKYGFDVGPVDDTASKEASSAEPFTHEEEL